MDTYREFVDRHDRPFVVREAVVQDAGQLLAGYRVAMEEGLDYLITQPEELTIGLDDERAWIEGLARADNSVLLIAEQRGQIIGWATLQGSTRLRMRHTALLGITVARPWRDCGVGTALIQVLLDWAAANPVIEKVKLGVIADNARALHLYRKFGLLEEGRLQREYKKADGTYLDYALMARFVG